MARARRTYEVTTYSSLARRLTDWTPAGSDTAIENITLN